MNKLMNKLRYCNHCKENSMVRKIYTDKLGNRSVIEYCINKGCGSKNDYSLAQVACFRR